MDWEGWGRVHSSWLRVGGGAAENTTSPHSLAYISQWHSGQVSLRPLTMVLQRLGSYGGKKGGAHLH